MHQDVSTPVGDASLTCSDGTIMFLRLALDTPSSGHGVGTDTIGRRYLVLFGEGDLSAEGARLRAAVQRPGWPGSSLTAADARQDAVRVNLRHVRQGLASVPRHYAAAMSGSSARGRTTRFIREMLPLVLATNEAIRADRGHLLRVLKTRHARTKLSPVNRDWLKRLAKRYDAPVNDNATLRYRVDAVPPSLALAQAALETGWGRSRFAQEGNALFGEWTFGRRRGLLPEGRALGETHKIRSFDTPLHSVMAYMDNLNSNQAYRDLRAARAKSKALGQPANGLDLTRHLDHYAGDTKYPAKLRQIIRANRLTAYDDAQLTPALLQRLPTPVAPPLPDIQVAAGPSAANIGRELRNFWRRVVGGDAAPPTP